jgi:hypothetical protein|tara:strand:+ start:112 stop:369 length:258 start_codon:yes stop_codon:yes gene_type:complete
MENLKLQEELASLKYNGKSVLDATFSLYDYLGQKAGPELGKDVYKTALREKEPVSIREISNKSYTGKVMLYRKEFLKDYFDAKRS